MEKKDTLIFNQTYATITQTRVLASWFKSAPIKLPSPTSDATAFHESFWMRCCFVLLCYNLSLGMCFPNVAKFHQITAQNTYRISVLFPSRLPQQRRHPRSIYDALVMLPLHTLDSDVPPLAIQNVWHMVRRSSKIPTALPFTLTLITIFN